MNLNSDPLVTSVRGQRHQRREKQNQLLDASAELAAGNAEALLASASDDEEGLPPTPPAEVG